jgi:competence protein ComEA
MKLNSIKLTFNRLFTLTFSAFALMALSALPITSSFTTSEVFAEKPASKLIDINSASAEELTALKGVGKKRAQLIVADREANGPFSSIDDLTRIKGIGPKTIEKNKALITASQPKKVK